MHSHELVDGITHFSGILTSPQEDSCCSLLIALRTRQFQKRLSLANRLWNEELRLSFRILSEEQIRGKTVNVNDTKKAELERSSGNGTVDQSPFGDCTELPEASLQYFPEFKNISSPAWKRFQYLFKRSALIGASILLIMMTLMTTIISVQSFLYHFYSHPYTSVTLPWWLCILLFLLTSCLSVASWLCVGRTATLPYVAPVRERASGLSHEQVLLRGSSPPKELELLMPAVSEGATSSAELLRPATTADGKSNARTFELGEIKRASTPPAPQEQRLG